MLKTRNRLLVTLALLTVFLVGSPPTGTAAVPGPDAPATVVPRPGTHPNTGEPDGSGNNTPSITTQRVNGGAGEMPATRSDRIFQWLRVWLMTQLQRWLP